MLSPKPKLNTVAQQVVRADAVADTSFPGRTVGRGTTQRYAVY